ncbi:hypothetical protein CSUI_003552 [Cystoisospora suis]|uniref:Uncharacterized protein n=1 Tax=Cystoisospora suis TaxID=483139 RepID=A0A2C6KF24_9APIC|nr:hypothetical protein CSUI_003552 [Cystoisospora suis]
MEGTMAETSLSRSSCTKGDTTNFSALDVQERDGTGASVREKETPGLISSTSQAKHGKKEVHSPFGGASLPESRGGGEPSSSSSWPVPAKDEKAAMLLPLKCPRSSELFMEQQDITSTCASSGSVSLQNDDGSPALVPGVQHQTAANFSEAESDSFTGDCYRACESESQSAEKRENDLPYLRGNGLLSCCFAVTSSDKQESQRTGYKASVKERQKENVQDCHPLGESNPQAYEIGGTNSEGEASDTMHSVAFSPLSFQPGKPSTSPDRVRRGTSVQGHSPQEKWAGKTGHSGSSSSHISRKGTAEGSRSSGAAASRLANAPSPNSAGHENRVHHDSMGEKGGLVHFLMWCGQPCSSPSADSSELIFIGSPRLHRKRALPGRAGRIEGEEGNSGGGVCGWGLTDAVFDGGDTGGVEVGEGRPCRCTPFVRGDDFIYTRARETETHYEENWRRARRGAEEGAVRRDRSQERGEVEVPRMRRELWRYEDELTGKAYIYQEFETDRNVRFYAWVEIPPAS